MVMESFRVKNVLCDHYLADPNEFSRLKYGHGVNVRLPVLRIFGIADHGEKCCAHIHGYLPFIVFRTGAASQQHKQFIGSVIRQIAALFNEAGTLRNDPTKAIYHMSEEKGRSMYGYYPKDEYFLRVYMYDPELTKLCVLSLQKECIRNELLQPYNSHIPYVFQFFIDYSIFGMDFVHFSRIYLRSAGAADSIAANLPENCVHSSPLRRSSTVKLEFDVFTDHILNPQSAEGNSKNPGLEFIWREETARYVMLGLKIGAEPEEEERPEFCEKVELDHLQRLSQMLAKLVALPRGDSQEVAGDIQQPIHDAAISQESIPAVEIGDSETPSPLGEMDDLQEESDVLWENRTLQLMGFKVEEEEVEAQFADTARPEEYITIDDEEEVPDVIQIDDDEDDETDSTKLKCNEVEPDLCPPLLRRGGSAGEASADEPVENGENEKRREGERHNETWLGDETIIDLPSHLNLPTPITKLVRVANLEEEKRLMELNKSNVDHLSVMSLEILALPTEERRVIADPALDPLLGVFFTVDEDVCNPSCRRGQVHKRGFVLSRLADSFPIKSLCFVDTEMGIYEELERCIRRLDPDILLGYDITRFSWGYLSERAAVLKRPFLSAISRINGSKTLQGRTLLECWRIIRRESPLRCYSFSNVAISILGRKVPRFPIETMKGMLASEEPGVRASRTTLFRHLLCSAVISLEVLRRLDIFVRTSQMARVIGIQFKEVLGRGSQYRVESMLLRLAKRFHYFAPSISPEQRNLMDSPETIALNLEPESGVYRDPVVVLDFQSLYPSVAIAYNYCFTTCLGKLSSWKSAIDQGGAKITLGALKYDLCSVESINSLLKSGLVHISPTGGIFVRSEVRRGLLSVLLQELLDTRVMVKRAMKVHKSCPNLLKLLKARQLALKLVANVTYGYTAANCLGVDACPARRWLTQSSRRGEKHSSERSSWWSATRRASTAARESSTVTPIACSFSSKEEAFRIGNKIAEDVSNCNPHPVKLKFEKVMVPCALLTKKRYVGMCYETSDQVVGVLESKGIETVRRDVCLFVSECMEKVLSVLFGRGLEAALQCLRDELGAMHLLPLSNFVITTEYRGEYAEEALLPVNKIARDLTRVSPRLAPLRGERINYLVVEPGEGASATVTSCVVSIERFLASPAYRLHYNYYVLRKLFPVLERVFELESVQLRWSSTSFCFCLGCGSNELYPWCNECIGNALSFKRVLLKINQAIKMSESLERVCTDCVAASKSIADREMGCENFNCPVKQRLISVERSLPVPALKHHLTFSSVGDYM